jgi:hypothetical protein
MQPIPYYDQCVLSSSPAAQLTWCIFRIIRFPVAPFLELARRARDVDAEARLQADAILKADAIRRQPPSSSLANIINRRESYSTLLNSLINVFTANNTRHLGAAAQMRSALDRFNHWYHLLGQNLPASDVVYEYFVYSCSGGVIDMHNNPRPETEEDLVTKVREGYGPFLAAFMKHGQGLMEL